ncbi:SH3 domain-containing protein [uncultured Clostridium sp.]|uniref:SH3 domain-containing protein n=4 Tax=uncultured Clostridium sp. TaxID=59620 RepID=UPI00261A3FB5|nr:SH3 domain-containing protein [uncultured Clostridium sp.]
MIFINKLKILSLLVLSGMLVIPSKISEAEEFYSVSERDLIKLLEKYKDEEVIMEDGLVLTVGEAINLPMDEGLTIYNKNVAEVVNGRLVGKATGSTFISQEIDDTVYILEVCIMENKVSTAAYSRSVNKKVNRDYYKVFIDPGHGGYDNGAVQNGVLEDEINLQVSKKIEDKLKSKGVQVKMSRYDDTYLSLTERTVMSNNWGSDVFVSIHQNSATNSSGNGIETYYHPTRQDGKELASEIQNDLIASTNASNRGVKSANYAVIRTSNMPSSLVECGFISNPTEANKLSSSSYQDKVAEGIVNGIMDYLQNNIVLNNGTGGSSNSGTNSGGSNSSSTVTSGTVKVNGALNVRSGAGTSYSVIGSLNNGAKVEIVETNGTWYKIKYGSGYGYISKDYVTVSTSSSGSSNSGSSNNGGSSNSGTNAGGSNSSSTVKSGTVKVNGALNVRSGAGTSYSVIGSLNNGTKVEIVETNGTWYKIKYGSGYGYISKDYVIVSTSSSGSSNSGSSNNGGSSNSGTNAGGSNSSNSTVNAGTVKVNGGLNVRSGAGTSYSVIGSLNNGAKVEIVETSGTWYKIKYGSGYGYVSKDYVTVSTSSGSSSNGSSNSSSSTVKSGTVKVNGGLNVRSGAGTSYSVIGSLNNGAKVEIVETSGTWYKIKYGSGYGYVSKDYVTVSTSSGSSSNGSSNSSSSTVKSGTVKVNGGLNVRSGAGTSYSVIGSLNNGAKVEIVETNGTWYKIKYGSGYGYVSKDYVLVNTKSIEENIVLREGTAVTLSLKVRDESNYEADIIGTIAMGEKVSIIEDKGQWSKIQYNGTNGYILNEYVDFNIA